MQSFSDIAIPASIKNALEKLQFVTPTEVQAKTLPLALEGHDVIACASTGSGKTGAFAIPAITMLINNPEKNALVLAPTRELAQQIAEFMRKITDYCEGISMVSIVGGFDMNRQLNALRRKPRIIIATPGRLTDHLRRRSISLANTGILILDEGDRMLDMGFAPQLDAILQFLPQKRQTMLFTATLPPKVKELSRQYLHKPKDVSVGKTSQPVETVAQYAMTVAQDKKNETLLDELNKRAGSVIVFARTQRRTDAVAHYLEDYGVPVTTIHGGLTQGKRNRAIQGFKAGDYRVLVATDIAARGIDVPAVAHVINFDLPLMDEDYVHRVGRTARNGAKGEALSFVSHQEYGLWNVISKKYNVHSDDVIDPRKNKKGKGKSAKSSKPAPTRPARSKDNSFFVPDELPPIEMIEEGTYGNDNNEELSVKEMAEKRRSEKRENKYTKGFQRASEAFDPEDRVVEKALAEENLALDMQDGVRVETPKADGFDPAERYGKRKKFGSDRKERFGSKPRFERRDRNNDFFEDEISNRGSKPFVDKFFSNDQPEESFEERPQRRFNNSRGGNSRFGNKGGGERRFNNSRGGFKKFGGGDRFESRGGFDRNNEERGNRFEKRDKFSSGGGRFERGNRFEKSDRFEKTDRFESRGRFEKRDKFGGDDRPARKSFSRREDGGFEKRSFSKGRDKSEGFGGDDRPKKKNNWFSKDKDRRSANNKRNGGFARY